MRRGKDLDIDLIQSQNRAGKRGNAQKIRYRLADKIGKIVHYR